MERVFIEENNAYSIDCRKAIWATNQINKIYHEAKIHINDVDFVIENESNMIMLEYKNALIQGADNPGAFNPAADNKVSLVTRKFYDSLHYLTLEGKKKTAQYIYVVEYPNSDIVTRKRLRNRIKRELPFQLQKNMGNTEKLIDKFDVLSIDEWNSDKEYGRYPILPVQAKESDEGSFDVRRIND